MKRSFLVLFTALATCAALSICCSAGGQKEPDQTQTQVEITEADVPLTVPVAGNTYHISGTHVSIPTHNGYPVGLTDTDSVVDIYFRVGKAGVLNLGLMANAGVETNSCTLNATVEGATHRVVLTGAETKFYPIGRIEVAAAGYIRVSLQGVSKTTFNTCGNVYGLRIGGEATTGANCFCTKAQVAATADNWAYWARRGPSVHMGYTIGDNIEYFYNELTVTEGNDVTGSYFMTNGFGEGYCGFQVNSASERRILFSVWSPYGTDNPADIPADQRVLLVRKGEGVKTGEFGNEGSGGQSYLVYPWRAGVTYKVLTRVKHYGPSGFGTEFSQLNEYTAYFYDPDQAKWRLIAAWRRPDKRAKTYTNAHSFLENFNPEQGRFTRECRFGNQWTRDLNGRWAEVAHGRFTHDNTANQKVRGDYYGGLYNNCFVLRNCGFFDENTAYGTTFTRTVNGPSAAPDIDLEALAGIPSVGM